MNDKENLTICIAAYNNNTSLERALNSIKNQTIANRLNVLVSDDFSPIAIDKKRFNKFKNYFNEFIITRQHMNLGVLSNAQWLFNNVKTNFYTFLQHDDVIFDIQFYEKALKSFEINSKLVCYFGNSVVLNCEYKNKSDYFNFIKNSESMYSIYDPNVVGIRSDKSIAGHDLIFNLTNQKIKFNTSWSAVIFKRQESQVFGGFGGSYTLSKGEAALLNVYREEEHFALLYLLCCIGDCQLEENPTVIRILEQTSFSRSPTHPGILMTQDSSIFAMYKLASIIESYLDNESSHKIIKHIFNHISHTALKFENSITKKFFKTYKLKNKKYSSMVNKSLKQSRRNKSNFETFLLLKAYFRYYKNLLLEGIFRNNEKLFYIIANFKLKVFIKYLINFILQYFNNILKNRSK